ncbi:hypothetical protein AOLI_G00116160 [Acnodon oligacanthus]
MRFASNSMRFIQVCTSVQTPPSGGPQVGGQPQAAVDKEQRRLNQHKEQVSMVMHKGSPHPPSLTPPLLHVQALLLSMKVPQSSTALCSAPVYSDPD